MKGFDEFGVHELTGPEQREILGGEGFWEGVGYFAGRAVGWFVEEVSEAYMEWWEYAQTRIPMPLQP